MSIFDNVKRKPSVKAKPKHNYIDGPYEAGSTVYGTVNEEPWGLMLQIAPRNAKPFRIGVAKAERVADVVIDARKRNI